MNRRYTLAALMILLAIMPDVAFGEQAQIAPVTVGQSMPDFTLLDVDGNEYSISGLKGKNVMLVFPRGKVGDHWCQICHYQYAEFAEMELEKGIRDKYNLEILYVLPYRADEVRLWMDIFPSQMEVIEGWKNPEGDKKNDELYLNWAKKVKKFMPKDFRFEEGKVPLPFPVLVDADRTVSKGLDLFRTEWDRSEVDQNISSIYIIDAKGRLQFKYVSQNTFDRPPLDYITRILDALL